MHACLSFYEWVVYTLLVLLLHIYIQDLTIIGGTSLVFMALASNL